MELGGVRVDRTASVDTASSRRSSSLGRPDRTLKDRRRERLNTELLTAAGHGDSRTVARLLGEGASGNATCRRSGESALHLAAGRGHTDIVAALLAAGARPSAPDSRGRAPLHLAAWHGRLNALTLLLDRSDLQVDSARPPSWNDNDLDSWNHRHDTFQGEDDEGLTEGSTALHLACKKGHLTLVNYLLDQGASVDLKDARGLTALDVVGTCPGSAQEQDADSSPASLSSLETIAEEDIMSPAQGFDSVPITPLIIPDKKLPFLKVKTKRVAKPIIDANVLKHSSTLIAKSLLERGAKMPKVPIKEGAVRNQSKTQVTALHTAVLNENLELIELLLEENGCLVSWNDEGETPLHLAVRGWHLEPLKTMICWNNNPTLVVDARDSQGRTLLHCAVMQEWPEGVSFLLESGADVKTSNNYRENAFHLAAERSNFNLLEELLSLTDCVKVLNDRDGSYWTPVCKAVDQGSVDCTKLLVEAGADPTIILPGDLTLLHIAAENNFPEVLEYLLNETEAEKLKDARCRSERGGTTPLQTAAHLGHTECVEVLLAAGCDGMSVTTEEPHLGATALHLAARGGHQDTVSALVTSEPAALSVRDSRNWYPLHAAASHGHASAVTALLRAGADLSAYIIDEKQAHLTGLEVIVLCVPRPVDFLMDLLDSYIMVNKYPVTDPKCEVELRFDLLVPREDSKQLKVLNAVLNAGKDRLQERFLLHPIVETFLFLKWQRLRIFFYFIMFFYMIFTVSLTSMAVLYYVVKDYDILPASLFHCLLFSSLIPMVLAESLSVAQLQRYYLTDYESWVKWAVFSCSLVVGLVDPTVWWARHLAAVTVLLAWLELLFLVARCPNWGFYVLMFSRVATKIFKVLVTFTFLLTGFVFAFMIQFDGQQPFDTMWQSLVKVFVMMLEFDYEATFESLSTDWVSFVARSIFLLFVVLVAIVLMNLMVGLAVSDIALLEAQGRSQRLAKQVSFLSLLEILVCSRRLTRLLPCWARSWLSRRRAVPGSATLRTSGGSLECGDTCLPRHLRDAVSERAGRLPDQDTRLDELTARVEALAAAQPDINPLKEALKEQARLLQELRLALLRRPSHTPSSENLLKPNDIQNTTESGDYTKFTNLIHRC